MRLNFKKLTESDFPLLLRWLNETHVAAWYNIGPRLDLAAVQHKYLARILGEEQVYCFIIYVDTVAIGFIQFYPTKKFDHLVAPWLSRKVAALDFYIGEPRYLRQGWGVKILHQFLSSYVYKDFAACVVDPHRHNLTALRCYEKAGFTKITELDEQRVLMLKH